MAQQRSSEYLVGKLPCLSFDTRAFISTVALGRTSPIRTTGGYPTTIHYATLTSTMLSPYFCVHSAHVTSRTSSTQGTNASFVTSAIRNDHT
eukprot:3026219-Pyramimonas_sp.AAC.1